MKRFLTFLYLAIFQSTVSMASVTINMVESNGDVVATATGSLNLAGLNPTARGSTVAFEGIFRGGLGFSQPGVVGALNGRIFVGEAAGSVDEYIIETTHTFSLGLLYVAQSGGGNHVGIISRSDLGDSITVPKDYNSGEFISGTSTFPSTTLAAMKAVPGTYVFGWSTDSITLNIGGAAPPATYTLGGTISGLNGSVTLQILGGGSLNRSVNGSFVFGTALADESDYAISVSGQPTGQTCSVSNGSGTIDGTNVSNVSVSCATDPEPENIFSSALPSGATGTLSFTTVDEGCSFDGNPQFLSAASVEPAPPGGVSAIDGVVQFAIDGCTEGATVNISMDYGVALPPETVYWKVGNPSWYPLEDATVNGSVVQFSITDGGLGDDDPTAGRIADPSGAVLTSAPTAPTLNKVPTLSGRALMLLSMLLGLLVFFRREQLT